MHKISAYFSDLFSFWRKPTRLSNDALVLEDVRKANRLLRHMGLRSDETYVAVQQLDHKITMLANTIGQRKLPLLQLAQDESLIVLDSLEKLTQMSSAEAVATLLQKINNILLTASGLVPVAKTGQMFDAHLCDISATDHRDGLHDGEICEVIRQGYVDKEGRKLRSALVIVHKNNL